MIGDHFNDKWKRDYPWMQPAQVEPTFIQLPPAITRQEFDALKRDVEEMKQLLKRAKKYDEDNHEPGCEIEQKMAILRKVAEFVGINIDDVIGGKP